MNKTNRKTPSRRLKMNNDCAVEIAAHRKNYSVEVK